MTEIPTWWLVLSGAFFAINILFFLVLTVAVVFLAKTVIGMKPKLESLEQSIQELVQKVHTIAEKVAELTETVKDTVTHLGGNARSVAGNAQLVAQTASRQFERISPLVVGAITAIRVVKALNDVRTRRTSAKTIKEEVKDVKATASKKLATVLNIASHFLRR